MNIQKTLLAAMLAIVAIFAFASIRTTSESTALLLSKRVSQSPAEQDKRLENLPGKLSEAVKILRAEDYRTNVSKWSERDRGNGLSDGQLSLDGDAGYPYSDGGFSDCNHIDYYTLNYKRAVKDKRPSPKAVDPQDAEKALANLFIPLSRELKPLIESGYQATHARIPGRFNTATEMTLVKITEWSDDRTDSKKYIVESLDIHQSVYDHCSMRRD